MNTYEVSFKKMFDDEVFTFKLDFDFDDGTQRLAFECFSTGKSYEPDVTAIVLRAVKEGAFVIDVGANMGVFTILMAKLVGPTGLVLAFEPNPANYERLAYNVKINNLNNVKVMVAPVWDREEDVNFYKNVDDGGSGALWDVSLFDGCKKTRTAGLSPLAVRSTTLEKEIAKVGRHCSFLKVDAEGADERILKGLGIYRPDFIVAESNPFGARQCGGDNYTMRDLMKSYGYECFLLTEEDHLPAMVPDETHLTNGFNGFIYMNLLFSTLKNVGKAYPEAPNIKIPTE